MTPIIATALPSSDIDEVRRRVLAWAAEHQICYAEIARRASLSEDQVKSFMSCRSSSAEIVAHLVYYLPLELVYHCPRISSR